MPAESEHPLADERALSFLEIASVIRRREFYLNLLPYFLLLIPFIVTLNLLATKVDARLGLEPLFGEPVRTALFIVFTCAGVAVVWCSYAHLCLVGDGSPSPHLGGTRRLVRSGPYSAVRHPSVIGKLLGVIGAGAMFASPTFLAGMLPVLLAYSLTYNRFLQEAGCVKQFGDDYLRYRREVPFIIPSPRKVAKLLVQPGTRQWFATWVLLTVLFLQVFQLTWLTKSHPRSRYILVPLSFTSTGGVTLPAGNAVRGPAVMGPTITLEDIVRGILVMEEHPEKGLSLDADQRVIIARHLTEAARERQQMLAFLQEISQDDARARELASSMLDTLSESQKRYLREQAALPAHAPPSPPWAPLLRSLAAPPREK